jgi:hypothetical protein
MRLYFLWDPQKWTIVLNVEMTITADSHYSNSIAWKERYCWKSFSTSKVSYDMYSLVMMLQWTRRYKRRFSPINGRQLAWLSWNVGSCCVKVPQNIGHCLCRSSILQNMLLRCVSVHCTLLFSHHVMFTFFSRIKEWLKIRHIRAATKLHMESKIALQSAACCNFQKCFE